MRILKILKEAPNWLFAIYLVWVLFLLYLIATEGYTNFSAYLFVLLLPIVIYVIIKLLKNPKSKS